MTIIMWGYVHRNKKLVISRLPRSKNSYQYIISWLCQCSHIMANGKVEFWYPIIFVMAIKRVDPARSFSRKMSFLSFFFLAPGASSRFESFRIKFCHDIVHLIPRDIKTMLLSHFLVHCTVTQQPSPTCTVLSL